MVVRNVFATRLVRLLHQGLATGLVVAPWPAERTPEPPMEYTFGVEEEYQLIEPGSGALRSRARDVLALDWADELRQELQETTLEIGTPICTSAEEVRSELSRLRFQVATAAAARELAIAACGTHPFSRWQGHIRTEGERYARIERQYGLIARDEHNFGMHVHVAVPEGVDRLPILGEVRAFAPHLTALAASSPYYEGEDTYFSSFRMILWRRWPNAGIPPRFGSTEEYRRYVRLHLDTGVITDEKNLYWSIRPHPSYPTLEFRSTDVCPSLEDAVTIAALARAIVVAVIEGTLHGGAHPELSDSAERAILDGNEWRAARFGPDALFIDPSARRGAAFARDCIRRLVERVAPVAEKLGDGEALLGIERILVGGTAAERMRAVRQEVGGLTGVVEWIRKETLRGTGMDRRAEQRAAP